MRRRDFPKALALTAAGSLSLSQSAASAALLQCETLPAQTYPPGHLFRYLSEAQRTAFINDPFPPDLTDELAMWIEQARCARVAAYLPRGNAKTFAPLVLRAGDVIRGEGSASRITSDHCDCIRIIGHRVTIEKVGLFSTARTHSGITIAGPILQDDKSVSIVGFTGRDVFLQDLLFAVNCEYMSDSLLENVNIQECTVGIRLYGESVNDRISNCQIVCTGGPACILTASNPTTGERGEGLMVSNCLLASADSAFLSNGFLGAGFYNCICDLLTGVGFDMLDVQAFTFDGPWVDSVNACFKWANVSGKTKIGARITVGRARTTAQDNLIHWGVNNVGLSVMGGQLIHMQGVGVPLALHGDQVSVVGTNIVTDAGRKAAWITGDDISLIGVTGNSSVM